LEVDMVVLREDPLDRVAQAREVDAVREEPRVLLIEEVPVDEVELTLEEWLVLAPPGEVVHPGVRVVPPIVVEDPAARAVVEEVRERRTGRLRNVDRDEHASARLQLRL